MTDREALLHKLVYNNLMHLNDADRWACARLIVDEIIAVLETHGPLPVPGMQYFLARDRQFRLSKDNINTALLIHVDEIERVGMWYRTMAQAAAKVEPTLPAPDNYEHAYYELLELMTLIRRDPQLARVPLSMLENLLTIDRATGGPATP